VIEVLKHLSRETANDTNAKEAPFESRIGAAAAAAAAAAKEK